MGWGLVSIRKTMHCNNNFNAFALGIEANLKG